MKKKNFRICSFLLLCSLCFFININSVNAFFNINNNISKLNYIIIIGDSRMYLIENKREELNIPASIIFIAKNGANIEFLENEALFKAKNLIKNKNINYHIIFNLGVNDLNYDIDYKKRANEYANIYKKFIKNNKSASYYFLSVNPIDEDIINDLWDNIRTNKKIKNFNRIVASKTHNIMNYCDSYSSLKFNLPDGLHYDTTTDINIMNYILNDCVKFN